MLFENVAVAWRDTSPTVLIRHPEWIADALLGGFLNPSSAILVTGFWRSGTTWLLETLSKSIRAKPVFEPLMVDTTGYRTYIERYYQGGTAAAKGFMPFCSEDLSSRPILHKHLLRALTGAVPGPFVRAARFNIREQEGRSKTTFGEFRNRLRDALRTQVVAKFTRAHLLLPKIRDEIGCPVLHIRRDPRAVVESLYRQGWAGYLKSMSLEDYLLTPEDGRYSVFQKYTDDIRRCDEEGPIAQIAGYWALVEGYVDERVNDGVFSVEFERLCQEGAGYLNTIVDDLSSVHVKGEMMGGESRTSDASKSTEDRIEGWKEGLKREDEKTLKRVVRRFGMEEWLR